MDIKIFYSWQSDLPNKTNRTLIEDALEKVANDFNADVIDADRPALEIDSATKGVAGSVNIAESILSKIRTSHVFVADISIIGELPPVKTDKPPRKTSNPNVLFELGYAFRHLGENKTILLMNLSYGRPEDLPFDLRMRRVIGYSLPEGGEKAVCRKNLEKDLNEAVQIIVANIEEAQKAEINIERSLQEETIDAIETESTTQLPLIKRYMQWLFAEMESINSVYVLSKSRYEAIDEAINKSECLSINFAQVVESLATIGNIEVCQRLYAQLITIFERYRLRTEINPDGISDFDFDFYKFIGHELFVLFFVFHIRDGNWELIFQILKDPLYVKNLPVPDRHTSIGYIPQTLRTLEAKKLQEGRGRFSLHADILAKRYTEGQIGKIVSFQEFMDTDLFLFLHFEFNRKDSDYYQWVPPSGVYNHQEEAPKFLYEAERATKADQIGKALLVNNNQFVEKLKQAQELLYKIYNT